MRGFNQATLVGNVGGHISLRHLQDNRAQLRLSVATNEHWTDVAGGKHKNTEWHSVEIIGPVAEALHKIVKSGDPILVQGKIKSRKWTDANGVEHVHTQIRVDHRGTIQLLGAGVSVDNEEIVREVIE